MSRSLNGNEFWLDHDKKTVIIDGKKYTLKVSSHEAIYPIKEYRMSVYLDFVDKDDEEYLKIKRRLGDDWSINVLDSEPELQEKVLKALGIQP